VLEDQAIETSRKAFEMSYLELRGLLKRFGGLMAVNNLSFAVEEKEIVSLIGPNGAGKTTTFNMITKFIPPDVGTVIFNDRDITKLKPHVIAELGLVRSFQKTNIFPQVTVTENVKMGCFKITHCGMLDILFHSKRFREEEKRVNEKALEILDYFWMTELRDTLAKNLSYGQKRILEIAIAMASEPTLLLLDEPVAGLNAIESKDVMQLIHKIRDQNITILLVEHDMNVVMNISDRVVVINFGKKIGEGTPSEIAQNEEVIKAYLGERRRAQT
jgi:branched-chain amino acid transport system ATP-binding protein